MRKFTLHRLVLGLLSVLFIALLVPAQAFAASPGATQNGSVGIEATIPANPPTTGATITFPANGQTFTNLPINVTGICPAGLLVKLFKNEVFGGSTQCNNGSYTITSDLFSGTNELVARVYDALDQAGPDSNKVTVTFNDTSFGVNGARVTITTNYAKRGSDPNETLTWPIILSGGKAPYAVSIEWGDGRTDLMSRASAGAFDIQHIYDTPGAYNILIKATDTDGAAAFLQVVAVTNGPLDQDSTGGNSDTITRVIIIWWPMIIAVAMIIAAFFLGRRHQLNALRKEMEDRIHY